MKNQQRNIKKSKVIIKKSLTDFGSAIRNSGLHNKQAVIFCTDYFTDTVFKKVSGILRKSGFKHVVRYKIANSESNKNLDTYKAALEFMVTNFPNETEVPLVINFGGGLISDIGGFVAASFRRGIPYVQVPTTLLSCVDAGVGGKVGVNYVSKDMIVKNIFGAIHQPSLIFIATDLLATLPGSQINSGMAEVVKYGIICNREIFDLLHDRSMLSALHERDSDAISTIIKKCIEIKTSIVQTDERDTLDKRIVLNFGHTFGHAIESAARFRFTHGEAIAIGMLAEIDLGIKLGICSEKTYVETKNLLSEFHLPLNAWGVNVEMKNVIQAITHDKKNKNGKIRFSLPSKIGKHRIVETEDIKMLKDVLKEYL